MHELRLEMLWAADGVALGRALAAPVLSSSLHRTHTQLLAAALQRLAPCAPQMNGRYIRVGWRALTQHAAALAPALSSLAQSLAALRPGPRAAAAWEQRLQRAYEAACARASSTRESTPSVPGTSDDVLHWPSEALALVSPPAPVPRASAAMPGSDDTWHTPCTSPSDGRSRGS